MNESFVTEASRCLLSGISQARCGCQKSWVLNSELLIFKLFFTYNIFTFARNIRWSRFCDDSPRRVIIIVSSGRSFSSFFSHPAKGQRQCFGSFATQNIFLSLSGPSVPHLPIGLWATGHKAGAWLSPECSLVVTLFPNALQLLLLWPQEEGSSADPLGLLLLPRSHMGSSWGSVAPTMANQNYVRPWIKAKSSWK